MTATVRELYDCLAAGDKLRPFALFSDNAIALAVAGGGLTPADVEALATPAGEGGDYEVLVADVRVFPDGRAGAAISGSEVAYLTLVRAGDRWLIDAFDD